MVRLARFALAMLMLQIPSYKHSQPFQAPPTHFPAIIVCMLPGLPSSDRSDPYDRDAFEREWRKHNDVRQRTVEDNGKDAVGEQHAANMAAKK